MKRKNNKMEKLSITEIEKVKFKPLAALLGIIMAIIIIFLALQFFSHLPFSRFTRDLTRTLKRSRFFNLHIPSLPKMLRRVSKSPASIRIKFSVNKSTPNSNSSSASIKPAVFSLSLLMFLASINPVTRRRL